MACKILSVLDIDRFKQQMQDDEKSCATISKYAHDLRYFIDFVGQCNIDRGIVLQYKKHLSERYALTSANSMLAALNAFLSFMGWRDLCVRLFKVQRRVFCNADQELSREEYFSLVRTAQKLGNNRLSVLLQTICATGIRVSEVSSVTVEAVRKGMLFVSAKGKNRYVFIMPSLQKKLLSYAFSQHINSGMLFVTRSGKPLHRSNIWREMKNLCLAAGVSAEKVFPHNLRHLFAKVFYQMEKDIVKLADILGHSNINTTRIYTISSGIEHQRKMERMCLLI